MNLHSHIRPKGAHASFALRHPRALSTSDILLFGDNSSAKFNVNAILDEFPVSLSPHLNRHEFTVARSAEGLCKLFSRRNLVSAFYSSIL